MRRTPLLTLGRRPALVPVIAAGAILLVTVPLLVTADQVLAALAQASHADSLLAGVAGPMARVTAGFLRLFGADAGASGADVVIRGGGDYAPPIEVSWNCIGWQSLLLVGMSLAVGLRGERSPAVRVGLVVAALVGTMLVNVVRIAVVCEVATRVGYAAAIAVHDDGGAVLAIGWLCAFWLLAYRFVLCEPFTGPSQPDRATPLPRRSSATATSEQRARP